MQLQQVLQNLLTNALDAMAPVTDRPHVLHVRSEHLEDWMLISVQDSGTGILPEQAERPFDAFFTTKPNGIGLGLSICRSILRHTEVGCRFLRSIRTAQYFKSCYLPPTKSVFHVMLTCGQRWRRAHQGWRELKLLKWPTISSAFVS